MVETFLSGKRPSKKMVRPKVKLEEEEEGEDEQKEVEPIEAKSEDNFDSTLCQMSETPTTEKDDENNPICLSPTNSVTSIASSATSSRYSLRRSKLEDSSESQPGRKYNLRAKKGTKGGEIGEVITPSASTLTRRPRVAKKTAANKTSDDTPGELKLASIFFKKPWRVV